AWDLKFGISGPVAFRVRPRSVSAAPIRALRQAVRATFSVFAAAVAVPDLRPRAREHDKRLCRNAAPQWLARSYPPTTRDTPRSALRDLPTGYSDNHIPPALPDKALCAPRENRR